MRILGVEGFRISGSWGWGLGFKGLGLGVHSLLRVVGPDLNFQCRGL